MVKEIRGKDLRAVLMDSKVKPIKNPYYLITDEAQVIFVVSPGLNGIEFNKTVGSKSSFEGLTLYQCLYGKGILVLQRNEQSSRMRDEIEGLTSSETI